MFMFFRHLALIYFTFSGVFLETTNKLMAQKQIQFKYLPA